MDYLVAAVITLSTLGILSVLLSLLIIISDFRKRFDRFGGNLMDAPVMQLLREQQRIIEKVNSSIYSVLICLFSMVLIVAIDCIWH